MSSGALDDRAELPDRLGRGHGGEEEREVHRDALLLGRRGEVDGDERPEREAEAPVEVGERGVEQAR